MGKRGINVIICAIMVLYMLVPCAAPRDARTASMSRAAAMAEDMQGAPAVGLSEREVKSLLYLKYIIDDDGNAIITGYTDKPVELYIPGYIGESPVTRIEEGAFWNCETLEYVFVPEGVTSIGSAAFCDCIELRTVMLPSTLTSLAGHSIFAGCVSLEQCDIPDGVTKIGEGCFNNCFKLKSVVIPSGLTEIPQYFCFFCTSIESVVIPNKVRRIASMAFYHCTGLADVQFAKRPIRIDDDAFSYTALESVSLPEDVIFGVSGGDGGAFSNTALKSIVFPKGAVHMYTSLLSRCEELESVELVKGIGLYDRMFYGCLKLRSITIPEGTRLTGRNNSWIFAFCRSLTEIELPSSIENVGDGWFYGCERLERVALPDGITSIGGVAFRNCNSLKELTIPDSVTGIGNGAFSGCSALQSLTIPPSVTYIGEYVDRWTPWLLHGCASLRTIKVVKGSYADEWLSGRELPNEQCRVVYINPD